MLVCGLLADHLDFGWFAENRSVQIIWYLVAYLPVAWPVARQAVHEMIHGDIFSEFALMTVASVGAFAIGEFPEGVAVMLFYTVGETLQDKAVARARRDISDLVGERNPMVTVIRGGVASRVSPSSVLPGEIIEVKPGERVQLDGTLMTTSAVFDTAALTGESVPRTVEPGAEVQSGMIPTASAVRLVVTHRWEDSALSRIMKMVSEASARKAHTELFIRKFARIYTPTVVLLAALIVAVPFVISLFDSSFSFIFREWFYRALVFLVISCPCALVISVPLSYFAGIGKASRLGILFKGGNYIDAMAKVDAVAFDKTGTLTSGKFSVNAVECVSGTEEGMMTDMLSLESHSSHPLAAALCSYARGRGLKENEAVDVKEKPGHGLMGSVNGRNVACGNASLFSSLGISVPEASGDTASTLIHCAVDGKYVGSVSLSDSLKPDAVDAVDQLRSLGISDIVMLSGDKGRVVENIAGRLGIDHYYGDLLPGDKAAKVRDMETAGGHTVAFVGDGMNDAPVLALADVGVAMGALGSDVAIESADVVIQTDAPSKVATAVRVSRATRRIVLQNIIGAIAIKIIIMVLGAMGYASLWAAVFADVGVALLCVLNAMRIFFKRKL